jgi:hypothetical protein
MNEFIQNLLDFSQFNQEHLIVGVILFLITVFLIIILSPTKKYTEDTKVSFTDLPTVKTYQTSSTIDRVEKEKRFQFERESFISEDKSDGYKVVIVDVKDVEQAAPQEIKEEVVIVKSEEILEENEEETKEEKVPVLSEDQRPKRQRVVYHNMKLTELKALAKEMGMTSYSKLSKVDLIIRIKEERKKDSKKKA